MALVVNGERIEDAAIQAETMRLERSGQARGDDAARQARDNLAAQILVRQCARDRQIAVAEGELEVELMRMYAEYGGKSMFFTRNGLSEEQDEDRVKAHVRENVRVRKLVDEVSKDVPAPDETEIRAYFDEHPGEFVDPEKVRASHVVKRPQGPDDAETFATMVEVRRRLKAGEDFAALAEQFSDCSSEPGGDLGFFARGHMVEGFETIVFSMDIGEVSPVFLTQFGYHVARVSDRKEATPMSFEEVREGIANRIHEERRDAEFNRFLDRLRDSADIREVKEKPAGQAGGKKPGKKAGKKGKK